MSHAKFSSLIALVVLAMAPFVAQAESGGYSSRFRESGYGGASGSSSSSYRDTMKEGYSMNSRWGHDRGFKYDHGGWHQETPIFKGGQLVGGRERGQEWDRESGHNREWAHKDGTRYGDFKSRFSESGGGREWGGGSASYSGRGWGASPGEFKSNWGSRGYGPYGGSKED